MLFLCVNNGVFDLLVELEYSDCWCEFYCINWCMYLKEIYELRVFSFNWFLLFLR